MKTLFLVGIAVVLSLVSSPLALAQLFTPPDPSPKTAIETVELEPGRSFECLVLETVPGVSYVIEVSDDLIEWEQLGDSHFGLGHQVVTPMVERSPAPTPGTPPNPSPPALLPKIVSLMIRPATTGGLIASFRSMDSTGTVIRHFPELELSSGWQLVPLFVSANFSNHNFVIWNPGVPQGPPTAEQPLGPRDHLALETFEEHFEEIDLEVQNSAERTRNQPPPPPSSPGPRRFFRVTGDAKGDADGDGTPDWLEFALIAAGGPAAAGADPFDPDTDANGTPDGQENDSDGDGTPDAIDAAPGDEAVDWQGSDHLMFAFFPVSGTGQVVHVNDLGRVLHKQSVWSNGAAVALSQTSGNLLKNCEAIGIGDNGFILGIGEIDLPGDTGVSWSHCLVTWPAAGGAPVPLKSGEKYLIPVGVRDSHLNFATPPPPSDTNVNGDGKFVAHLGQAVSGPGPGGNYLTVQLDEEAGAARKIWQGTAGNPAVTQVAAAGETTVWIADNGLESGVDDFGRFKAGDHIFNGPRRRIVALPGGGVGAFLRNGNDARTLKPMIRDSGDSTWKENGTIFAPLDFSAERRFALSYPWEIWLNGKDSRPAHEFAPGLPAAWHAAGASLEDTTRHGWTLAVHSGPPSAEMLGMPIRLSTDVPASGVDNQSAAASDAKFHAPAIRAGNKDEFWTMIPAGGTTVVRVKSTASPTVPLLIDQSNNLTSDPTSLTGPDQTVELAAPATVAGQEFNLPLKIGSVSSASSPVRVKVMKPRVVNVSIWPLKRPGFIEVNPPLNLPPLPTKQEIENYLNAVYQPQIAVTFNVTIKDESVMAADPGQQFDPVTVPVSTLDALTAGKTEGNIQVLLTGGYQQLGILGGWTPTGAAQVWLPIGLLAGGGAAEKERWLNSMAHEIGHVFWGAGHPNDRPNVGKAALPGTDLTTRLMATFQSGGNLPKLIVKAEWDAAEDWLELNVDE